MDAKKKEREAVAAQLMAQAQVFASAWSLVGGPFDDGSALVAAEEAKVELSDMITAALAQPAQGKCETCNGHGMIGGFVRTGSGEGSYDGESCPDCSTNDRNMAQPSADTIAVPMAEYEGMKREAERWQRIRILGCAPYGTPQLDRGTVLRFQSLDEFADKDLARHMTRGEAALRTHENEIEAGAVVDGWDDDWIIMPRKANDVMCEVFGNHMHKVYSQAEFQRVWDSIILGRDLSYSGSSDGETMDSDPFNPPLPTAPPSAQAIETAAIMRCVDLLREQISPSDADGPDEQQTYKTLAIAVGEILALIPQDGRTQLEEFGMLCAKEAFYQASTGVINDADSNLRAIVTNLMNGSGK